MSDEERLKAMREGAEIAKQMFVGIVRRFPTRAEVGAAPTSPEHMHFQMCASTLNAMEFEDEDFLAAIRALTEPPTPVTAAPVFQPGDTITWSDGER